MVRSLVTYFMRKVVLREWNKANVKNKTKNNLKFFFVAWYGDQKGTELLTHLMVSGLSAPKL